MILGLPTSRVLAAATKQGRRDRYQRLDKSSTKINNKCKAVGPMLLGTYPRQRSSGVGGEVNIPLIRRDQPHPGPVIKLNKNYLQVIITHNYPCGNQ